MSSTVRRTVTKSKQKYKLNIWINACPGGGAFLGFVKKKKKKNLFFFRHRHTYLCTLGLTLEDTDRHNSDEISSFS